MAERMDIVGITHYIGCKGPSFYSAALCWTPQSRRQPYGKHAWLIEYNARTALAPEEWERETYAAIGAATRAYSTTSGGPTTRMPTGPTRGLRHGL